MANFNIEISLAKKNKGVVKKSSISFGDVTRQCSHGLGTLLAKIFRLLKIDDEYEVFETQNYKVYRFKTNITHT